MKYFLIYILIINVLTFAIYGIDKLKSKKDWERISEKTLILLAVFGGALGACFGMFCWHHKTKHKKFLIFIPIILGIWIAVIAFIMYKIYIA